jgi:hypothetical protein
MTVIWDVVSCSLVQIGRFIFVMMDAVSSCETSVNFYHQTTRRNIREDSHLQFRGLVNGDSCRRLVMMCWNVWLPQCSATVLSTRRETDHMWTHGSAWPGSRPVWEPSASLWLMKHSAEGCPQPVTRVATGLFNDAPSATQIEGDCLLGCCAV